GGAAEPGEHRGGTGPRVGPAGRGAGVAARSSVICATRGLQGHGAVPLRRTLAGGVPGARGGHHPGGQRQTGGGGGGGELPGPRPCDPRDLRRSRPVRRSEEHTSELQSRENLVCRLLLEKKKKKKQDNMYA